MGNFLKFQFRMFHGFQSKANALWFNINDQVDHDLKIAQAKDDMNYLSTYLQAYRNELTTSYVTNITLPTTAKNNTPYRGSQVVSTS